MSACPECRLFASSVTVTRKLRGGWVKRYRKCPCGQRWTTYEIPAGEVEVDQDAREQMRELEQE